MAHDYRSGDRDQLFLLPPSMWDWLEEDHLAFFVIDAIELVDTSSFDATHPAGPGAPAYDPRAMLGILIYAYTTGVRSSRAIAGLPKRPRLQSDRRQPLPGPPDDRTLSCGERGCDQGPLY